MVCSCTQQLPSEVAAILKQTVKMIVLGYGAHGESKNMSSCRVLFFEKIIIDFEDTCASSPNLVSVIVVCYRTPVKSVEFLASCLNAAVVTLLLVLEREHATPAFVRFTTMKTIWRWKRWKIRSSNFGKT